MRKKKGNMALKSVESQNVEFKSNWRDEYLKVICAFANADGGKLIIGIDADSYYPFIVNLWNRPFYIFGFASIYFLFDFDLPAPFFLGEIFSSLAI